MPELPVTEPLNTTIEEPAGALEALASAESDDQVRAVAADHPNCLAAWAELGERALAQGKAVQAYAYFRVGYHRGLDRIRQAGWRGRGKVPWSHAGNRGFLRSLRGLRDSAELIGESDEAQRCKEFLADLAPDAPPSD
jgi:hypothetical protein